MSSDLSFTQQSRCFARMSIALVLPLALAVVCGPSTAATIQNRLASNVCLEGAGAPADGKQLRTNTCDGTESQQFTLQDNGQIRLGSLCVDAGLDVAVEGREITLEPCHGGASQIWIRAANGEIRGANGKCMDVSGFGADSGVMLWTCREGSGQKWAVTDRSTARTSRPESSGIDAMAATAASVAPCTVKQVVPSPQGGIIDWSPDGKQYSVKQERP